MLALWVCAEMGLLYDLQGRLCIPNHNCEFICLYTPNGTQTRPYVKVAAATTVQTFFAYRVYTRACPPKLTDLYRLMEDIACTVSSRRWIGFVMASTIRSFWRYGTMVLTRRSLTSKH
jgi:hypothetical protein